MYNLQVHTGMDVPLILISFFVLFFLFSLFQTVKATKKTVEGT